jgi:hypothetical protein
VRTRSAGDCPTTSDEVLRRFDFIIGSIHGQFRLKP